MKKRILITGKFNSQGIIKGLALRGEPLINFYVMNSFEAIKRGATDQGFESGKNRISSVVSTFMMLKILRENKCSYFRNKTYKDAQACFNTVSTLRNQITGEKEAEEIKKLILPGVIKDKNKSIIDELLIPYLKYLEKMGYEDSPGFAKEVLKGNFQPVNEETEVIYFKEDPLSPLSLAALKNVYNGATFTEVGLFDFIEVVPFQGDQKKEMFPAYGSFNGFREIMDRIIKTEEPYDTFLISSPTYDKYARYGLEMENFPLYFGRGIPSYEMGEDAIRAREEEARKAGFSQEEIKELEREILSSLKGKRRPSISADEGRVYLGDINDIPFIYVKNVYLLGLEVYSGGTKEQPLLLDDDIHLIREKVKNTDLKTSHEITKEKGDFLIKVINRLIEENRNITISYGIYDTANLKAQAKPSVLSRLEPGFVEQEVCGFFEPHILPLTLEELFSKESKRRGYDKTYSMEEVLSSKIDFTGKLNLSVSSADTLIQCPYKFLMEKLLKISPLGEEKDIVTWLLPEEAGSLCHEIISDYHMTDLFLKTLQEKEEIMENLALKRIEEKLIQIPPSVNTDHEIKSIKGLLKKYVNLKNVTDHRKMVAVEKDLKEFEILEGRLSVWGKLDFAEKDSEKKIYIGDIKTGKTVTQDEKKIETFIQALIYCMAYEEQEKDSLVVEGRYLYPKIEREYGINYDEKVKEDVKSLFDERLKSINTGLDIKTKDEDKCKYCGFSSICKAERRLRIVEDMEKEGFFSGI